VTDPQRPPEASIDSIIGAVVAAEASEDSSQILDLKTLADKVELLSADFGRWDEFKAASAEYIREFKTELEWHRRIRLGVVIACAVLVAFLTTSLVLAVLWAKALFGTDPSHALTALIVATVTGSVVVTIAVARGAFQTMANRNEGLPMPEHMKELVEAGKSLLGGGH
jgi:hypothetical protein